MAKYLSNKEKWMEKICHLAYDGKFVQAQKIIDLGLTNNFRLTKKDATGIIACCGADIRYSFVKPLVDIGGKFPNHIIDSAKEFIKVFKSSFDDARTIAFYNDMIKGYTLALKSSV
jgi:hypothetical protein